MESLVASGGGDSANDILSPMSGGPALQGSADRRVLIIDNNLLVAEAIVLALTQLSFSARFVMPITTTHALDLVAWQPGLALLDIDSVDSTTCLSFVSIFSDAKIPVAVMGSRLEVPLLGECVRAGASSVIDKGSPLADLVSVIARLLAGDVVLTADDKRRLLEPIQREARVRRERLAPFDVLTDREKCILAELMDGHSPDAIARRNSVSISTVRSQVKAILQKLGVNSQLAATSLARRAGWTLEEARDVTTRLRGVPSSHLEASA
jgi:two-component system, NarL family, nitrate/nitrite response regulator NarL